MTRECIAQYPADESVNITFGLLSAAISLLDSTRAPCFINSRACMTLSIYRLTDQEDLLGSSPMRSAPADALVLQGADTIVFLLDSTRRVSGR
jgi:hypothetical protein